MSFLKRIFTKSAPKAAINQAYYFKISQLKETDLYDFFNTSPSGLPADVVENLRKKYGPNSTEDSQHFRALKQFINSAVNPFNLLLVILSAIIYYQGDNVGGSIVIGMVVLSIITTFSQEYRSSNAVEKLQKMINSTIDVYRLTLEDHRSKYRSFSFVEDSVPHYVKMGLKNGEYERYPAIKEEPLLENLDATYPEAHISIQGEPKPNQVTPLLGGHQEQIGHDNYLVLKCTRITIKVKDLVRGDIVCLSTGDVIPADLRLLESKFLSINQSAMNGESMPAEKHADKYPEEKTDLYDYPNVAFQGTNVVSGTGRGVVISTGKETLFGQIKASISKDRQKTSFDRGIDHYVILMICFMVFLGVVTVLINGFSKSLGWGEAIQFSLAIAVGLTPEMLPMVISVNLAKGAISMVKKKVIVKRLAAIQNIGAMNILCTDKTGTLTDDHIVMEHSIGPDGKPSETPLRFGYLISFFQTGLRNLLDEAIVKKAESFPGIRDTIDEMEKIDEIPFDFERRRMSVIVRKKNSSKITLCCKGAAEETLNSCSTVIDSNGFEEAMTKENKDEIIEVFHNLNKKGLRVIGVAIREFDEVFAEEKEKVVFDVSKETEMKLIGFLTFLDPPKKSTAETIKKLNKRGIKIKVLTGDNELVAQYVCQQAGIDVDYVLTGQMIRNMSEEEFREGVDKASVFAKLTPQQKETVVKTLQSKKNVVGFMGDGINDSLALKVADCGISVDNAMDITKQCADIILLEKSLEVLDTAVIEGRTVFGNIVKYIKMGASSNFGNVFSMVGASFLLPFLPMTAIQVLIQSLLYDLSQCGIPFDTVDVEYLETPKKWDIIDIAKFMVTIGPISSIFDYLTWAIMWWYFGYQGDTDSQVTVFQTAWFIEGFLTQATIVHVIRTHKIPFIQSRASFIMAASTVISMALAIIFVYIPLADYIPYERPPSAFYGFLFLYLFGYCVLTQIGKHFFYKYNGIK